MRIIESNGLSSQVATQLLTAKEKDEMVQLVDIMLGFGISYRHPKPGMLKANYYGIEGQSALALDPPIDTLVKFKVISFFSTAYFGYLPEQFLQPLIDCLKVHSLKMFGIFRFCLILQSSYF